MLFDEVRRSNRQTNVFILKIRSACSNQSFVFQSRKSRVSDHVLLDYISDQSRLPRALLYVARREPQTDAHDAINLIHVGMINTAQQARSSGLAGGKGGYGTMLRAGSSVAHKRQKKKQTLEDVSQSRDLAGNRIADSIHLLERDGGAVGSLSFAAPRSGSKASLQQKGDRYAARVEKQALKDQQTAAFADLLLAVGSQIDTSVQTGFDAWLTAELATAVPEKVPASRKTERTDASSNSTTQVASTKRQRSR